MIIHEVFPTSTDSEHEKELQQHYSEQLYARIITNSPRHFLVRLSQRMNLQRVEGVCREYDHQSGPGKPVVHGANRLLRIVLLRCLYGYSLREMEEQMNGNLYFKWFAGYSVFEPVPDHTTLDDFELWLMQAQSRTLFDEVIRQIEAAYPQERKRAQLGDSYAMRASAARENLIPRIRHTATLLLDAYRLSGLLDRQSVLSGYDWLRLFGAPKEKEEMLLDKEKRRERLQTTVLAALDLLKRMEGGLKDVPKKDYPEVHRWCGTLGKIIADECAVGEDGTVCELPTGSKGGFRIGSATDVQASYRVHGTDEEDVTLGYNIQVAATTSGFIRETKAYTGAVPDQSGVAALIAEQVEHLGSSPPALVYDCAAGSGKVRAEVDAASGGKTRLIAKLPPYENRVDRFGPYDFVLSEDGKSLTCPNGKTSQIAYPSGVGDGRTFRFFACQCWKHGHVPKHIEEADLSQRCPHWEKCRDEKQGSKSTRTVFISDYRQQVLDARIFNETEEFAQQMKLRPRIERVIFELTHYNGARQCQRRGLVAADYQAKMAAVCYNLKLWMRKLEPGARPRKSWR